MSENNKQTFKDERYLQNEKESKVKSLEWTMAFIQVIMFICIFKQNIAWRGFAGVQLFACGCALCKKYSLDKAKPYLYVGIALIIISVALTIWFMAGM